MLTRCSKNGQLTKGQHCWALFLAGFPVGVGLIISMLRPTYFAPLLSSSVQPLGWLIVVGILVLIGMAYIALLGSFALSNMLDPPRWLVTKAGLRLILVVSVTVLLVLPSTLLTILGPVALMVMESRGLNSFP